MRARGMILGTATILAVTAGCSSDSDGFEVRLLAGGGDQADGTGADASLPPSIVRLTSDGQGTLWGVSGTDVVLELGSDGSVRSTQLQLADGSIQEIAVAPDGRVYVLLDEPGQQAAQAVVLELSDGELVPAVGLPAAETDAPGPVSPDGEPAAEAELGYVGDIAVDAEGRLLLTERVDPGGADAGFLLRRVDDDGRLSTVAGRPNPEADGTLSDDEAGAAFFPDGTEAAELTLFAETAIAAGPGEQVVLQTTQSVFTIDGGTATTVLGAAGGGTAPPAPEDGPFGESVDALSVDYRPGFPLLTLAVNADGGILAGTDPLTGYDPDAYHWQVEDGSDRAQTIADTNADDDMTSHPTLYVAPDGQAYTASVVGGPATWLDADTIAVAAAGGDDGDIIVTIDLPD